MQISGFAAPGTSIVSAPSPVSTRVSQSQVDPAVAAQTLSVPEIRSLPSPLKEATVIAAVNQGRLDVTAQAAQELSKGQIATLPSPTREIVAATQQTAPTPTGSTKGVDGGVVDVRQITVAIQTLDVNTRQQASAIDAAGRGAASAQQLAQSAASITQDLQTQVRDLQAQVRALSNAVDQVIAKTTEVAQGVQLAIATAKQASSSQGSAAPVDLSDINARLDRQDAAINKMITEFAASWDAVREAMHAKP